jgi:peptide/nickel transport system substrate-binding protein
MQKIFLTVAFSIATLACRPDSRPAAKGETGGTVVVAASSDASSIFPPHIGDETGVMVRDLVYDRLAEIGEGLNTIGDGGFTPRLARRWTWAPDSLSIAFELDPGARWHDGQPVRANDVRFSFQTNRDPKVAASAAALITTIDSVSVRDSLTAVVWYKKRTPEQFYDFVYQIFIIPEHVFKSVAPEALHTAEETRKAVGTGRFRMARWDAGQRLELVADTANYRGRPKLDRVIIVPTPDFSTALAQLMAGQADVYGTIPADQVAKVDSSPTVRAIPYSVLQYGFMGMNNNDPKRPGQPNAIFGDRRVRRALSMAVDRKAMLQNVFGAIGKPSYGPFPRSLGTADTTLKLLPYDVSAAKVLLDSAGWKEATPGGIRQKNGRPLQFTLMVPVSSKPRMGYAVLLQDQLRKVGAQVDLEQLQGAAFFQRQMSRDFDAALLALSTDPSPGGYRQMWGRDGLAKNGGNYVSYRNPMFDALLDSALTAFDPNLVKSYASRAYQTAVDDAPAIWLYDVVTVAGVHRRLEVVDLRADGWWAGLSDWRIPPSKRIDRDRIGLTTTSR